MHKITAGRLYIPTGNLIRPTKTAQTDGLSNYLTKVNKAQEFYYGTDWEEENPSERQEKNPAITNPRWENADGNTITKALVGR